MITLAVCFPVLNQEESTQRALDSFKRLQSLGSDVQYIIIDNGCRRPVREWLQGLSGLDIVIQNHTNVGLPRALNQAMNLSTADYLLCTHTDVEIFEQDWDRKIIQALESHPDTGVMGFFGALGIGTPDIYRVPYQMQQLVRRVTIAGNRCKLDPHVHGQQVFHEDVKQCAVLDGFGLIVRKDLRFEEGFGPHHMYDNDICLTAIQKGMKNYVINMDINHYGGRTDVNEDWATPFGKSKAQVHSDAHPPFYEKWRSLLPYMI